MNGELIFEKVVDKSTLAEGITIPEAYHEILYSHLGHKLSHGESMQVNLHLQDKVFTVSLKNLAFDTKKYNRHDILQLRYSKGSPIATALQDIFSETNGKLTRIKANESSGDRIKIPAKEQEYVMIYASDKPVSLVLEPVPLSDIRQEMDQLVALPELMVEEMLSSDETAGIDEKIRIAKIRRMNHAIGDSLKHLYGYRCQICGAFIGEKYGSTLIHAHHIDYFSRSMNNDASNIMIVCPNHHGVIHDMNPVFNVKDKTYKYPNGYTEGLLINKHL